MSSRVLIIAISQLRGITVTVFRNVTSLVTSER
jgi:hypothetical protein